MTPAARSSLRRLSLACAPLLLAAALSACGGDGSGNGSDGATVLSDAQAEEALLTQADVGDEFSEVPDEEDDDETTLGCLDEIEGITDEDAAEAEAEVTFEAVGETGLPTISSGVASFASEQELADAFDAIRAALADCTSIEETDEDGLRTFLELSTDEEQVSDSVDDQINIDAVGSISSGQFEAPLGFYVSMVRIDNNAAFVLYGDLSDVEPDTRDDYVESAVDRLTAVAAGE